MKTAEKRHNISLTVATKFGRPRKGGTELRALSGGFTAYAPAPRASVLVRASSYDRIRDKAASFAEETGFSVRCIGRGKSLEIAVTAPNAIAALMGFLGRIEDWNVEEVRDFILFFNDAIGDERTGERLGLKSLQPVVTPGALRSDERAVQLLLNVSVPEGVADEDVYRALQPVCDKWDLGIIKMSEPAQEPKKYSLRSAEETALLGAAVAAEIAGAGGGKVVALTGDLGAGKTTLTQAMAKALGISEPVTSPTFTLIQEYKGGTLPLYHFDIYRLDSEDELLDLGYEDYFYGDGVSVVEWADKAEELLPKDAVRISLAYGNEENTRIAAVQGLTLAGFTGTKA